jgi:hypothetical protein
MGEAPYKQEGISYFVFEFPHRTIPIPDDIMNSTRWTKSGMPDKRMKSSAKALAWIKEHWK